MRQAALAEVKDDLSRFLRLAESEEILITRHGKPAGVLIGFESEDDWLDDRLEHHPEFLRRIAEAREGLRRGWFDYRTSEAPPLSPGCGSRAAGRLMIASFDCRLTSASPAALMPRSCWRPLHTPLASPPMSSPRSRRQLHSLRQPHAAAFGDRLFFTEPLEDGRRDPTLSITAMEVEV